MAYAVELSGRSERDLVDIYEFLLAEHSDVARRWFNGLELAVQKLQHLPRRCPIAPETRKSGRPARHLLYGGKPDVYRVLYEIDEPRKIVRVLAIRHGARDEFVIPEQTDN
jgi:plasmid stabilization system protein ParE